MIFDPEWDTSFEEPETASQEPEWWEVNDELSLAREVYPDGMFARPREIKALWWFGKEMKLDPNVNLSRAIVTARMFGTAQYYDKRTITGASGKKRLLCIPRLRLKFLQRQISRHVLTEDLRAVNTSGGLGGSCLETLLPHRGKRSMLCFDFKDAFFHVGENFLMYALQTKGFTWYVSNFICSLCLYSPAEDWIKEKYGTNSTFLPQGGPASPKLFSIACHFFDKRCSRLAERVGGTYSRYADNVYFGMPTEEFPEKIKHALFAEATKAGFVSHKVRVVNHGNLCHALGLNLIGDRIANSRDYKRSLRKALTHLEYTLDHGLSHEDALLRAEGLMSVAVRATLPANLLDHHKRCREKVDDLWLPV